MSDIQGVTANCFPRAILYIKEHYANFCTFLWFCTLTVYLYTTIMHLWTVSAFYITKFSPTTKSKSQIYSCSVTHSFLFLASSVIVLFSRFPSAIVSVDAALLWFLCPIGSASGVASVGHASFSYNRSVSCTLFCDMCVWRNLGICFITLHQPVKQSNLR